MIISKIKKILNAVIKRGSWYNEVLFPNCKKFWKYNTFNTEVVNLGSTSGLCAFNYEGLPIKGANWALSHNPLSGDRAILKNYFSYLSAKKSTVIIPLCAFTSLAGSYNFMEDRFYTLIYPSTIPDFSYKWQQKVKSVQNNPIKAYSFYALCYDLKSFIYDRRNKVMSEEQMEADSTRWIKSWLREFSLKSFSDPLSLLNKDARIDAAAILNDLIDFCKERNFDIVMVLPPMYHTLATKFTFQARKLLLYDMLAMVEDKTVRFINYIDDEEFAHNRTLFYNSFLLNKKGAKKFTAKVLKDIGLIQ